MLINLTEREVTDLLDLLNDIMDEYDYHEEFDALIKKLEEAK